MSNDEPRLRIYWRHDGIEEWVATAALVRGELTPLVGGCDEDAWDLIAEAVRGGNWAGEITTPGGLVYAYEAR